VEALAAPDRSVRYKNMKRISVIGCCGSGKSTLSLKLHQMTGLPIIHLDKEYWHSGWRPSESEDFRKRLEPIIEKDGWIIDGHYFLG
jgi:adenylate kinase family enzyme